MRKGQYFLAIAASCANIAAYLTYNWEIIVGQTRPNAASWAVWSFLTVLNLVSYQTVSRDLLKSVLPIVSSILCITTLCFALFAGRFAAIGIYDWCAVGFGALACLLWWFAKSRTTGAVRAQILLQVAINIGCIPTYLSVWSSPQNELPIAWVLWSVGFALQGALVWMSNGKRIEYLYPTNCALVHFPVALLALR